jgi:hypothetical protein
MRAPFPLFAVILIAGISGCAGGPKGTRLKEQPVLSPSKQVQRKCFACKDLVRDQWIGVGSDFSTDNEKIILVARLDPSLLDTRLTFEILSPDNKIIEKEDRNYDQVRDVGVFFDPVRLIEKGGGPGRYQANIFSDSNAVGSVVFFVEDFREDVYEKAINPQLKEIEWVTPE